MHVLDTEFDGMWSVNASETSSIIASISEAFDKLCDEVPLAPSSAQALQSVPFWFRCWVIACSINKYTFPFFSSLFLILIPIWKSYFRP